MSRGARLGQQDGFTLVELMAATVVLVIGMLGATTLLIGANQRTVATRGREGATNVQRELVERARSIPYPQLNQGSVYDELQALPGLEDDSASPGYQIVRRGFTYTITLGVCSVDDGKDGYGTHDAASFCADSNNPPSAKPDRNPDDYKVISTDLTWSGTQGSGRSREQALINSPGTRVGPSIVAISINAGTNNVITTETSPVTVSATTSFAATTVSMSVDGEAQGEATGAGTSWSWPWAASPLVDGTYVLSARSFDALGRTGPSRSLTVTLNRRAPVAPTGLVAGRNGAVVELEWLANEERDIVGYTAYRDGTAVSSCTQVAQTNCQDLGAPATGPLTYTIKALDRDPAGAIRAGAASAPVTVTDTNQPPYPPTNLTLTTDSGGDTVLSWQAPSPADPDGGSIAFYRIYRDGTAVQYRYDRTGLGTDVTWTDAGSAGQSHSYWITAVDSQLAESTFVGPVSR